MQWSDRVRCLRRAGFNGIFDRELTPIGVYVIQHAIPPQYTLADWRRTIVEKADHRWDSRVDHARTFYSFKGGALMRCTGELNLSHALAV